MIDLGAETMIRTTQRDRLLLKAIARRTGKGMGELLGDLIAAGASAEGIDPELFESTLDMAWAARIGRGNE